MKTITRILLTMVLCVVAAFSAQAHAIWIESDVKGSPGQKHTVRVYYGEYETAELEKTSAWYSDLKNLELMVLAPDGTLQKASLADKGDFLEASFTPSLSGRYVVYTSHKTKELGGNTRYEFTSKVEVQVGKVEKSGVANLPFQLSLNPGKYTQGSKIEATLTQDNKPLSGKEVAVMGPEGWTKKIKTDDAGKILFNAEWKGRYVLEYGNMQKQTGEWHGKSFENTWQGLTTSVLIQ